MKSKLLKILLSVVVAFSLWCFVIMVEQPESETTYYDIPVVLQYEDALSERGLMIVSERPTVTLRLSGTRTHLDSLNESNINVLANVSGITGPGTHEINYSIAYPGNIPNGAVTVQSQSTDMVQLKVEKRITKNVMVVPKYIGSVPEGMIADKENAVLDYSMVEVTGPESALDQIKRAVIEVDLSEQTQSIVGEFDYILCNEKDEPVDAAMVTTNVEAINLTLRILRVKEISLIVNVVAGGGATETTSSIDIQPKTIRVSGSDAILEDLEYIELGTINLGEMFSDASLSFPIVLPEGVTNETGINDASVVVKFPNLRSKVFKITKIQALNVPAGMTVDMITQALEIKVRGPVALVDAMTENDIEVTVDFADAEIGTDTKRATITMSDEFAAVGAVGSYSVSVTVKEAEEA